MIRGVHTMFYSSEPEALRAFLRDVLGLPGSDVGDGGLIFDLPEADIAAHPLEEGGPPAGTPYLSFYCDEVEATMAELAAKGVRFTAPVENHGYGLATRFAMPGGVEVELYQPLYTKGRDSRDSPFAVEMGMDRGTEGGPAQPSRRR